MEFAAITTSDAGDVEPAPRRVLQWPRWLPPARVTWICLAVLAVAGTFYLKGASLPSLLLLPAVAATVDLPFQRVRFSSLRWPDAAIASGLFLTLLLPPMVPLAAAGAVTIAAVGLRHAVRFRGRPVFNPAATGLLLGAVLFGTAPAWWVALGAYGEWLLLVLAAIVVVRNLPQWQLPVTFFAIYAPFTVLERVLFGAALAPRVLLLGVFDPSILFFGLFMLPEPRTAPSHSAAQPLFAGVVAVAAVFLSVALPSLGIITALLAGNVLNLVLRWERPTSLPDVRGPRSTRPTARKHTPRLVRWSAARRASAAALVLLLVGVVAVTTVGPTMTPSVLVNNPTSGGSRSGTGLCLSDNPNIPSASLSSLHQILGPSVILSYDSNTGIVRFYDPVNQVTVTETDLYEDYGYAEFNGDDYAVNGCSP